MEKYNSYANDDAFAPTKKWSEANDEDRLICVKEILEKNKKKFNSKIEILEAKIDGQIIVNFIEPVGSASRGTILLDLEELLKSKVDVGLTVWLEPLGDKNSLRNLRGIEVVL
jgi:precorrin-3B methylase